MTTTNTLSTIPAKDLSVSSMATCCLYPSLEKWHEDDIEQSRAFKTIMSLLHKSDKQAKVVQIRDKDAALLFLFLPPLDRIACRYVNTKNVHSCTQQAQGTSHLRLKSLFFPSPSLFLPFLLFGFNFPNAQALINKGRRETCNWKHSWEYQLRLRSAPFSPPQQR